MARFNFDETALQQIAERIAPVAGWSRVSDINGNDIGFLEVDAIVPTDTSVADWIEARGEPTREGDVLVFESVISGRRSGTNSARVTESRTTVYVVEIDGGTAAYIEQ